MTKTNVEIVKGFIEALNLNRFDRIYDFCSQDCVAHIPPWVGVGLRPDVSSGEHVIVHSLVPGGNAAKALRVGDEILRISDLNRSWETFQDIKNGFWGQGIPGTPLTITVKRDGTTMDLYLERGLIPGFDNKLSDFLDLWRQDKLQNWPDLKIEIQVIFEKDDLAAFFAIDKGTNVEFQRTAIWSECNIYRIKDGKIIEMWGVEDGYMQLTQLGYQVTEPQKIPAA